ncbi:hypothetical protein BT96DRAFT_959169 [Gymnopus androsaceus JB14]|uniref:Phenylacetaldoxime dehydratase n=1 Tax=Gymnopus androsaceus JB14 TaxID=1447944 RepID=A0A6A4H5K6_9AGAR|nr:hypothetical protein BT96DRAFT_959169 [Gymnopus androsaceus JB14]
MLESAIPPHLRVPRTQALSTPPDYTPPFPAYCARFPESVKHIVMAIFGAQSRHVLRFVEGSSEKLSPPVFWEIASVLDTRNAQNLTVIAYWPSKAAYESWCSESGFEQWWESIDPEAEEHGWFKEIFLPPVERFETVFSGNDAPEGAAWLREEMSGMLKEHVYWGSMRDRLPVAQTDPLLGEGIPKKKDQDSRKQNLCVIRSGQDWSATLPRERSKYLETMHPVLIKGMDFLRDEGRDIGCYSCRFMNVLDHSNAETPTDRTFGLAFFDDIASLEKWSKQHKTHLDIFGRFLQYAKELDNEVSLRLFHEVFVLQPDQQQFEYIGCHSGTGMLASIADV